MSLTETKKPLRNAQVAAAKKAVALKAANAAKRPQPGYLKRSQLNKPLKTPKVPPAAPERTSEAHRSQAPPRLMSRHEVVVLTGATYPTIWAWMRAGTFPRSRICGGKSMWLSTEVEAWLAALPLRRLKGDSETPRKNPHSKTAAS